MKNIEQTKFLNRNKDIISALWIFLSLNYIFCDVLSNMESSVLKGLIQGNIANIDINQEMLLAAGISLEIPFLMIVLSKVLKYKYNKIINIIAGVLMIIYQVSSFFMGGTEPSLHYIFFSIVEVLGNLIIVLYAFNWKEIDE